MRKVVLENPYFIPADSPLPAGWKTVMTPVGEVGYSAVDADGAMPRGTRIVKVRMEKGDQHQIGAKGTVLGSHNHGGVIAYFVTWDAKPDLPIGVMAWKIGPAG